MFVCIFSLVSLSVLVQSVAWKDLSLKWCANLDVNSAHSLLYKQNFSNSKLWTCCLRDVV